MDDLSHLAAAAAQAGGWAAHAHYRSGALRARSHPAAGVSAGEWFLRAGRLRATGSPATGLAHTALGRYDCILIDASVQPWDIAAGLALCQQMRRVIVMEYTTHPRILVCGEALEDECRELARLQGPAGVRPWW